MSLHILTGYNNKQLYKIKSWGLTMKIICGGCQQEMKDQGIGLYTCFNCKRKWIGGGAIPPDCYYCGRCPENVNDVPSKEEIESWLDAE